jgi:hypothetical protein
MAKTTLDSLEHRHGTKPLAKRGAPEQVKSTEVKSFASPIDMTGSVMGKRATNKVGKAYLPTSDPAYDQYRTPGGGIAYVILNDGNPQTDVYDWGDGTSSTRAERNANQSTTPKNAPASAPTTSNAVAKPSAPRTSAPVAAKPSTMSMQKPSAPVAFKPSASNFTPRSIKPTSSRIKDVPMPKKPAATSKMAKSNRNEVHPLQSDNNPVGRGGQARGIPNSPYRSYMKASGTPTPVPTPKPSTKSPTPVPEAKPRIYDVSYPTPNRTTPTAILPEDRQPQPTKKPIQRGSNLVAASKPSSLKKDIDSGFVPSIGVKRGKQSDVQSPAKNAYPSTNAHKSASASLKKVSPRAPVPKPNTNPTIRGQVANDQGVGGNTAYPHRKDNPYAPQSPVNFKAPFDNRDYAWAGRGTSTTFNANSGGTTGAVKSARGSMKKDITAASFVPSIGVGGGKKKHDGMPSTFILDHKKKK